MGWDGMVGGVGTREEVRGSLGGFLLWIGWDGWMGLVCFGLLWLGYWEERRECSKDLLDLYLFPRIGYDTYA